MAKFDIDLKLNGLAPTLNKYATTADISLIDVTTFFNSAMDNDLPVLLNKRSKCIKQKYVDLILSIIQYTRDLNQLFNVVTIADYMIEYMPSVNALIIKKHNSIMYIKFNCDNLIDVHKQNWKILVSNGR